MTEMVNGKLVKAYPKLKNAVDSWFFANSDSTEQETMQSTEQEMLVIASQHCASISKYGTTNITQYRETNLKVQGNSLLFDEVPCQSYIYTSAVYRILIKCEEVFCFTCWFTSYGR